jgi:pimeloyl-ACP methyl ester carboxylesterase
MMQRPVMNPMFLDQEERNAPSGPSRWRRVFKVVGRIVKFGFTNVFRRKEKVRNEVGTAFSRFVRGLLYRLMFVPTILAVLVTCLVVTATHPRTASGVADPVTQGVYYDPVDLLSLDGTKLEGWLVPVMDAKRVLTEKETILHKRLPAIVLVHDFGASRQQVLPLVAPLHEAGYVLLAINLRGQGSSANTGSTFGLNEAADVRAAVDMLRRRPFVDPEAVGVVGIGTGATAALLAAEQDSRIRCLVLDHPVHQFQDVLDRRIGPKQPWLSWVRPICKWTFEICYRVNASDVDLNRFGEMLRTKPTLMFDEAGENATCVKPVRIKQVTEFFKKNLVASNKPAVAPTLRQNIRQIDAVDAPAEKGATGESWPPQRPMDSIVEKSIRK